MLGNGGGDGGTTHEGAVSGEEISGMGGGGGRNRWPKEETMALLRIRSEMDAVFRESSLKGPLWEEISRKMGELGYQRRAKKCKEKFENVYKYHKRTKEGRATKSVGKTYRFFDQIEALEHHQQNLPSSRPLPPQAFVPMAMAMAMPPGTSADPTASTTSMVVQAPSGPATMANPISIAPPPPLNSIPTPQSQPFSHSQQTMPMMFSHGPVRPIFPNSSLPHHPSLSSSPSSAPSSSSSTSSDEEILGRRKRKRKWKDFFERLMKEVINKQEELQQKFLEAIEKREHDRRVREEDWKLQERARLNKEQEILAQERSNIAAKEATLLSFLQKVSDQQQIPLPSSILELQQQTQGPDQRQPSDPIVQTTNPINPLPPLLPQPQPELQENTVISTLAPQKQPVPQLSPPLQLQQSQQPPLPENTIMAMTPMSTNGENQMIRSKKMTPTSSSRWPKAEIEALIKLRTNLDQKYQGMNGPKGPMWEEISVAMAKIGYNRNAKRCKEKWENINKYFKKVKESHKKRPDDCKTCPYFHQLEALYREKNKATSSSAIPAQPEQHWPLPIQEHRPHSSLGDPRSDNSEPHAEDTGEGYEDEDDQGSGYEIMTTNNGGDGQSNHDKVENEI